MVNVTAGSVTWAAITNDAKSSTSSSVTTTPPISDITALFRTPWMIALLVIGSLAIAAGVAYIIYRCFKRRRRPGYNRLRGNLFHASELSTKKKIVTEEERDTALMYCTFYLRSRPTYQIIRPLSEVGSRSQRQWFLIQDNMTFNRKLVILTKTTENEVLTYSNASLKTLQQLLSLLKHPNVCPVEDIAFQSDQQQVITMLPYHIEGSLKDYIYRCPITADWEDKYSTAGRPLSVQEMQLFGRQILSGLLYLKNRGFSWLGHIHSANILMCNGTCKVSGYENTLMGLNPLMDDMLSRYCYGNMKQFDVLSFGHMMYEMAVGQSLTNVVPTVDDYYLIDNEDVKNTLRFIFTEDHGESPSFKKINFHPFFNNVTLSNVTTEKPLYTDVPENIRSLLKRLKNIQVLQRHPYMYESTKLWIRPHKDIEMSKAPSSGRESSSYRQSAYLFAHTSVPSVRYEPSRVKLSTARSKQRKESRRQRREAIREQAMQATVSSTAPEQAHSTPQTTGQSELLADIRKGVSLKTSKQ